MIDTIRLVTQDFEYNSLINEISDYPLLNEYYAIRNGEEDKQPELIKDATGKMFYGKALTLKGTPIRNTGILSINQSGLSFTCSLPKFLRGSNYILAVYADLIIAMKEIEKQLEEIGIKLKVSDCKIDRLDLTKNAVTKYRFYEYIELLRKLNFKRDRKALYNTETFTIGTKSRAVCNYDKVAEIINNDEKLPEGINPDTNIFRCESRLLNSRTINAMFKMKEVKYSDLDDLYGDLHTYRKNIVKDKMLLWESFPTDKYSTLNYDSLLRSAINNPDNNNVGKVVDDFLDCCILKDASPCIYDISNNVENLLDTVEMDCIDKGLSKRDIAVKRDKYKNQFKKKIGDKLMKISKINDTCKITIADLYNELYEKLYIA